ncbi:MAG: LysM peptidoglycan-binding domain-containing protein [Caldilineales bacterium]|nr:LysM peptidoglycan-binding domain-containing protein [Caldilineales bacterium]
MPHSRKIRLAIALLGIILSLFIASCGQVITRPTPAPPTPTPSATPSPPPTSLPTDTPPPYTPEPTATPTVSPTPVIHTIVSGETLIAIAQRYGVSLAALQEANGILDPRALRVGQQLFIPTDTGVDPASGSPTPTPTPLPIEIGPLYFGNNPGGGLWALGEVVNDGQVALEGVRLRVGLRDAAGELLGEAETIAQIDLVDVGARAPFGLLFEDVDAIDAYEAQVISAVPAPLSRYYRDLVVEDIVEENIHDRYVHISGSVRNAGPEEAVGVYVVVTLYDALDQVIGVRRFEPEHNIIAPGGVTTFSEDVFPVGGPYSRSAFVAGGLRNLNSTSP